MNESIEDTPIDMKVPVMHIVKGTYKYISGIPKNCHGHLYYVHNMIIDVPSYQRKVLVEALSGPDRGLWFSCSPSNFAARYVLEKKDDDEQLLTPLEEKEIDNTHRGPGY